MVNFSDKKRSSVILMFYRLTLNLIAFLFFGEKLAWDACMKNEDGTRRSSDEQSVRLVNETKNNASVAQLLYRVSVGRKIEGKNRRVEFPKLEQSPYYSDSLCAVPAEFHLARHPAIFQSQMAMIKWPVVIYTQSPAPPGTALTRA